MSASKQISSSEDDSDSAVQEEQQEADHDRTRALRIERNNAELAKLQASFKLFGLLPL